MECRRSGHHCWLGLSEGRLLGPKRGKGRDRLRIGINWLLVGIKHVGVRVYWLLGRVNWHVDWVLWMRILEVLVRVG